MALAISIRLAPPAVTLLEALQRRPIPIVIASRRRRLDYAALFQHDAAAQAGHDGPSRRTTNALRQSWQPCPAAAAADTPAYRSARSA